MKYIVTLNGKDYEVDVDELDEAVVRKISESKPASPAPAPAAAAETAPAAAEGSGTPVKSPMPGTILKINVAAGQKVKTAK